LKNVEKLGFEHPILGETLPQIFTCIFKSHMHTSEHVVGFGWVPFSELGVANEKEEEDRR